MGDREIFARICKQKNCISFHCMGNPVRPSGLSILLNKKIKKLNKKKTMAGLGFSKRDGKKNLGKKKKKKKTKELRHGSPIFL